jgi:hypothetical protein
MPAGAYLSEPVLPRLFGTGNGFPDRLVCLLEMGDLPSRDRCALAGCHTVRILPGVASDAHIPEAG